MSQDLKANMNQACMGKQGTVADVLARWRREQKAGKGASSGSSRAREAQRCDLCHADTHRCARELPRLQHCTEASAISLAASGIELKEAN